MKARLVIFSLVLMLLASLLMAFRSLLDLVLPEPWGTLLFLILVPLIVQGFKFYRDRAGKEPPRLAIEIISLVLSAVFVFLAGGFAAIKIPALPAWGGDTAAYLAALSTFLSAAAIVLGLAWAAVSKVYDVVFKTLLEKAGFATLRALKERRAIG
ncbi:MAG TPA: hypothetical protein VJK02_02965 [Anaerolineales bacterium]|nr:hypothetical protein [Anaerolineales bacterium]